MALQSSLPAPQTPAVGEDKSFSTVWYQYFWYQWSGFFPVKALPLAEPDAPAQGFVLYCDAADGQLKAKASSGTVTVLALP